MVTYYIAMQYMERKLILTTLLKVIFRKAIHSVNVIVTIILALRAV